MSDNIIERLANELFGDEDTRGEFRQLSPSDREKPYRDPSDYGEAMNLGQLGSATQLDVFSDPNGFRKNPKYDSLHGAMGAVIANYPTVSIRFGGALHDNHIWVDTAWIHYGEVDNPDKFREDMVLWFKSTLRDVTEGVCPTCDDRIDHTNEHFRYPEADPTLWATTDEFDFRENEEWGPYLRIWWDD